MFTAFRHTWRVLTSPERKKAIFLQWTSLFISLADIAALIGLLAIINFYVRPGKPLPSFIPSSWQTGGSIVIIAVFVVLFSLKNITAYIVARAQDNFSADVAIRLSDRRMREYQLIEYMDFVHTDSSVWIRRIALEPFEFTQQVLSGIQQIITQVSLVSIAVIAILWFNAKLFLMLMLLLIPASALVFYFIKKRTILVKQEVRNSNERSYQFMLEAVKGYVEGNVFHANEFFRNRFMKQRRSFGKSLYHSLSLQNFPPRVIEIFAIVGLFLLIIIARWMKEDDLLITIGAFMAAAYKVIPGLVKIINLAGQVRSFPFSEWKEEEAPHEKHDLKEKIESIAFNNVDFTYYDGKILHDLSFEVNRGEMIGISGLSGKGKTTVLNILLGFISPEKGEIKVNGKGRSPQALRSFWNNISYVRQQTFLIHDTILKNILLDDSPADPGLLDQSLRISGLDRLVQTYPEGIEKLVSENGRNISGGQQQRISIARAIYKNGDMFLMDEPFNELDKGSAKCITEKLHQIAASGKIVILVTHDAELLSFCDKTIVIDA